MDRCDVIGCGKPAAWVYLAEFSVLREQFLCDACLCKLKRAHPRVASCYAVCDSKYVMSDASAPSEVWDEDTIVIGERVSREEGVRYKRRKTA